MEEQLYVVRVWDGFEGRWFDVTGGVPKEEADRVWSECTENGTKQTKYADIDYYRIFEAGTQMFYSDEGDGARNPVPSVKESVTPSEHLEERELNGSRETSCVERIFAESESVPMTRDVIEYVKRLHLEGWLRWLCRDTETGKLYLFLRESAFRDLRNTPLTDPRWARFSGLFGGYTISELQAREWRPRCSLLWHEEWRGPDAPLDLEDRLPGVGELRVVLRRHYAGNYRDPNLGDGMLMLFPGVTGLVKRVNELTQSVWVSWEAGSFRPGTVHTGVHPTVVLKDVEWAVGFQALEYVGVDPGGGL